jgi:putative glutamine amidotransferase
LRPIIGITCSRLVGGNWGVYSPGYFMDYTYDAYSRAILTCGGAPIIVPVAQDESSLACIVERLDGLVLTGGPDVHPRFYNEQPLSALGELDADLDVTELAITRKAIEADLPVLAICRGIQLLNVCFGGTLYQDISEQVEGSFNHIQKADKGTVTHTVRLEEGTLLHRLLGVETLWVNGRHHQALKDVAAALKVAAQSPDGIIESVEHPGRRFVLGVQWHPEGTWEKDPHSRRLFSAFVSAAQDSTDRLGV